MPPDRSPLGWLILPPLGCLVLAQTLLAWTGVTPIFDGTLADPDSYMRLNRVLALHEGGAWFDPRDLRINPPEGHVQSVILCALLLGMGVFTGLNGIVADLIAVNRRRLAKLLTPQQADRVESAAPRAPTRRRARSAAPADAATWS